MDVRRFEDTTLWGYNQQDWRVQAETCVQK